MEEEGFTTESRGGEPLAPHQALLCLAEQVLETDAQISGNRLESDVSPYTVAFKACPRCKEGSVEAEDGPVAVPKRVIERALVDAGVIDLDEPVKTQRSVRRRVVPRDAHRYANPYCRRRSKHLHVHHIVWRSRGGETSVVNELAICVRCHAAIHAGFLRVTLDAEGSLVWATALEEKETATEGQGPIPGVMAQLEAELAAVPVPPVCDADASKGESASLDWKALEEGLVRLGFSRREGRERLELAVAQLCQARAALKVEAVILEALKG